MESNEDAVETNTQAFYDESMQHIGIKRRSGRYPWGSGDDEYQRSRDFKAVYESMKAKGLSEKQIVEGLGMKIKPDSNGRVDFSSSDLRAAIANSTEIIRAENINMATRLASKGMGNSAIAERMGLGKSGESTVRGWLKTTDAIKEGSIRATANKLKEELQTKEFLDVGKGTQLHMGVSVVKLNTALAALRDEGYNVYSSIRAPQLGTDKMTTFKILTKEGNTWHDALAAVREARVGIVAAQSDDGGHTYRRPEKDDPISVDLKRVAVKLKEDGGEAMDGVIELRRGVPDLSLGGKNYAQVRVAVNGTHYLKGMAMYADDMPPGVDIRFNSNKSKTDPKIVADGAKLGAMKPMKFIDKDGKQKIDSDSPFGAQTQKPRIYLDAKGKQKTSPLNIVNEEGQWDSWSKSLSSQMLSKQSLGLAQTQLSKAQAKRRDELDTILKMTNPVVKEKLLMEFADKADAAAVHLKAAAIDRQSTAVILPMNTMRRHEIYAPNHKDGEKVTLVRHPHGGPFEIPELTVNNRNPTAKRILKGALDAVGIHHSVAAQLSGADFDGDTVLVIPNDGRKIKTRPPLEGLKNFDAKVEYSIPDGNTSIRRMTKQDTQKEMGRISNLITDMTIHGANDTELARAVRHSMVVIDAEKHGLNYKLSEQVNGIKQLKEKYQGRSNAGASTIISRAGGKATVPQRKQLSGNKGIDPKTGEKIFKETGASYQKPVLDKNGKPTGQFKTVINTTKGTKAEFAKDARSLVSDKAQPMELIYATHANTMKDLANQARKAQVALVLPTHSKAAQALYSSEVKSLKAKLDLALRNAPLERRAQIIGNESYRARVDANPGLDKDDLKKIRYQSLEQAREFTGANKKKIGAVDPNTGRSTLTDREWDAIQAGAVPKTTLREILRNADMDRVRELATPRPRTTLTTGQRARIKSMASMGRSPSEIAELLDIPRSTIVDNIKAK